MHTFRDKEGREWVVVINVTAVKKCRALVGVDLYGLVGDGFKGLGELLGDPVRLVDVLYVLCKDEADGRGVTDEQFGRGMAGDAIEHASNAFLEELTDFFPDPRVRAGLKRVMDAGRNVQTHLLTHMESLLGQIDPASEARKLIASSGGSPASSASTPDPSPSASST